MSISSTIYFLRTGNSLHLICFVLWITLGGLTKISFAPLGLALCAILVFERKKQRIPYLLGTMIELPRAALTAGEIAKEAEFFSFGTNDLTQTTYGISRDDAGKFVPQYRELEILPDDPFTTIDADGVGRLMKIAAREGRETKPRLKLGICGEHGGDPRSIHFCQGLGLAYVSCSPYRVPIARLAAAQAALKARSSQVTSPE